MTIKKISRRIFKTIKWLVFILFLLLTSTWVALQQNSVQTWIAKKAATYLSDELHTKVTIDKVEIDWFERSTFHGLYIEDLQHDTLLYSKELYANYDLNDLINKRLDFDKVTLKGTNFYLKQYAQGGMNLQFIIDYFNPPNTPKNPAAKPVSLSFYAVNLQDINFRYSQVDSTNKKATYTAGNMNYKDIYLQHINGDISNLFIVGDSVAAQLVDWNFREQGGLMMNKWDGQITVSIKTIQLNQATIKTKNTNLQGNIVLKYKDWKAFDDFEDNVNMNIELQSTHLSGKDIAYFSPLLNGLDKEIDIKGSIKGTVNNLYAKNMDIKLGQKTQLLADLHFTNLTTPKNTILDATITKLVTDYKDLKYLPIPPFGTKNSLPIPIQIEKMGTIAYQGTYKGNWNNFTIKGTTKTALGEVYTDIAMNLQNKIPTYKGYIKTKGLNLKPILPANTVDFVALDTKVEGKGFNMKDLQLNIEGNINKIIAQNNTYQNIFVAGNIEDKKYVGKLKMSEERINIDFDGVVNFQQEQPTYQFKANIIYIDLKALGYVKDPKIKKAIVKTKLDLDCKGKNIDDIYGDIMASDITLWYNDKVYNFDAIDLQINGTHQNKELILHSDIVDATLQGAFKIANIGEDVLYRLNKFFPSYIPFTTQNYANNVYQNFNYNLVLKNTDLLTSLFLPSLKVANGTTLKGMFNENNNIVTCAIKSDTITYEKIRFNDIAFETTNKNDNLDFFLGSSSIVLSDSIFINNVLLKGVAHDDSLATQLNWSSTEFAKNNGTINSIAKITNKGIDFRLLPSEIYLQDTLWNIGTDNKISIADNKIDINNFKLYRDNQSFIANGIISKDPNDKLQLTLKDFRLNNIGAFVDLPTTKIDGVSNGGLVIANIYNKPVFSTNIKVKDLSLNTEILGDIKLISNWNPETKEILLMGGVDRKGFSVISFDGKIFPNKKQDNLDVTVRTNGLSIKTFQPYIKSVFSDLDGIVSGDIRITGSTDNPQLQGDLNLRRGYCKVAYLNTAYNFVDVEKIHIESNEFTLKKALLYDERGDSAWVNVSLKHKKFQPSSMYLDMKVDAHKFQALKTTSKDNELFYGTAYMTGDIRIKGYFEDLKIRINGKTEKGSELSLPLGNVSDITEADFIHFVTKDTTKKTVAKNWSKLDMVLNLKVTPDAVAKIVFDSKVGDEIMARGNADMVLEINTWDGFKLTGDYFIEGGNYLFTLQDVAGKKFDIEKGGSIIWTGDPYNADIDLTAKYQVEANLNNLLGHIDPNRYNYKVPTSTLLNLKGKLLNPDIQFAIKTQTDETTKSVINNILQAQEELNRQVFALITFKSFMPPSDATGGIQQGSIISQGIGKTVGEMFSNQLSNLLDNVIQGVSIDFTQRKGSLHLDKRYLPAFLRDIVRIEVSVGLKSDSSSTSRNAVFGEVNLEADLNKDGTIILHAFNKSNQYSFANSSAPYTQGTGVSFKKDFEYLFKKKKKKIVLKKPNLAQKKK